MPPLFASNQKQRSWHISSRRIAQIRLGLTEHSMGRILARGLLPGVSASPEFGGGERSESPKTGGEAETPGAPPIPLQKFAEKRVSSTLRIEAPLLDRKGQLPSAVQAMAQWLNREQVGCRVETITERRDRHVFGSKQLRNGVTGTFWHVFRFPFSFSFFASHGETVVSNSSIQSNSYS